MPANAPETIDTERLVLTRPTTRDVHEIFSRYASDPDVVSHLSWPKHRTVADSEFFLGLSDAEWRKASVGPYLVRSRADGSLLGATGLSLETPYRASTGYVLAKDAWGRGLATEVTAAMVKLAWSLGVRRLHAYCHTGHRASARVLEKCGFEREGVLRRFIVFPNLDPSGPLDVLCYAITA